MKNVHYILKKPWDDKDMELISEETHLWWWELDRERQKHESEAGLLEPDWQRIKG